jgi:glycosyltransferase involved in cell wall biosynthesis
MIKPLEKLDILITIFNQEEIIERVLHGIFRNTTTPFNLILVFDGCTDRTKTRALKYLKKVKPRLMKDLVVRDTPNLFETRANNFGFKLAQTNYLITVQDDMVVKDYGWERRMTYPLRKFEDVLGVTARVADDLENVFPWNQQYKNRMAFEFGTLSKDIFAIRDAINRGPIAFRIDYLKSLDYLNDRYAPGALDDLELSLRAWNTRKLKVGAFGINYTSKKEWSKVNAPDSTMKAWDSCARNLIKINDDFKDYILSEVKHDEDIFIGDTNIDYIKNKYTILNKFTWLLKYPLRFDKRVVFNRSRVMFRNMIENFKKPFMRFTQLYISSHLAELIMDNGVKKGMTIFFKEKPSKTYMTICMPTHEMKNFDKFLRHSLDVFVSQSFKDFDIVISDHSKKDGIKNICKEYSNRLNIHYYRNPKGPYTSSANLNNAIKHAHGKLIKVMFLDDYLYSKDSLQEIVDNFDLNKDKWLVTGSEHTRDGINYYMPFYPKYNDKIHLGDNTISSPSVLTIKNESPLLFDKRMIWLMDVDYYKRLHDKFGPPKILNKINAVNRTGDHQVSNTSAGKNIRGLEYRWVLKKFKEKELLKIYDNRSAKKLDLPSVTIVGVGENSIKAVKLSQDGINFGDVKYTDSIDKIKEIRTDFALMVSAKGFVLRSYKWDNNFLNYDLIGDDSFSLRSKKYLSGIKDAKLPPENILKEFSNSAESFGFSKDLRLVPKYFAIKKYFKNIWLVTKVRRWYEIAKKGH